MLGWIIVVRREHNIIERREEQRDSACDDLADGESGRWSGSESVYIAMTIAQKIRQVFRDLFGSRLVNALELRVIEVQQECERRIADKDDLIASLRADLASARTKIETYEVVLLPLVSPVGNLFKPKPDPQTFERLSGPEPGSWAAVQEKWYKQQAEEAAAEAAKENNSGVPV